MITCAFDNSKIIKWLRQRGTHIKNENWDKLDEINRFIRLNLKKDSKLLDKLQRPCSVFVTMLTEEGYYRAVNYNDNVEMEDFKKYDKFLSQHIYVKDAAEPTDIIWENRNYTRGERNIKKLAVAFIIFILLCISFSSIFLCQKASLAKKNKYPKVNCQHFVDDYKGRNKDWTVDAINEYRINKEYEENELPTHFEGTMQCFC